MNEIPGHGFVEDLPLVSIVTPSYNMGAYIEQTILSVLSQDYPRIEYLVVDGGSTDGTLEILKRHEGRLRFTSGRRRWSRRRINRGFRVAAGSIFAWLNADDTYLPGAVSAAVDHLVLRRNDGIVYGNAYWIDAKGNTIAPYPTRDFDRDLFLYECFICQPACFFRKDVFGSLMLNADLQYAFDYDLWIRAAAHNHFGRLPRHLACSRMHCENRTLGRRRDTLRECMQVLRQHYGYVPFRWVHTYCSYLLDRTGPVLPAATTESFQILMQSPDRVMAQPRSAGSLLGGVEGGSDSGILHTPLSRTVGRPYLRAKMLKLGRRPRCGR